MKRILLALTAAVALALAGAPLAVRAQNIAGGTVSGTTLAATNTTNQVTLGAAAHTTVLSATAPAGASQTLTLPDPGGADTIAYLALAQTFTNKTESAPVFSGTVTGTYTLGGTPTISAPVLSGSVTGTYTLAGTPTFTSPTINGPTINVGGNVLLSVTAPTISSGFGGTPSIVNNNGPASFSVNVGTGGTANSGVVGLPTAANGWSCHAADITTQNATVFVTLQTASATNSATFKSFTSANTLGAWVASDILAISCWAR